MRFAEALYYATATIAIGAYVFKKGLAVDIGFWFLAFASYYGGQLIMAYLFGRKMYIGHAIIEYDKTGGIRVLRATTFLLAVILFVYVYIKYWLHAFF